MCGGGRSHTNLAEYLPGFFEQIWSTSWFCWVDISKRRLLGLAGNNSAWDSIKNTPTAAAPCYHVHRHTACHHWVDISNKWYNFTQEVQGDIFRRLKTCCKIKKSRRSRRIGEMTVSRPLGSLSRCEVWSALSGHLQRRNIYFPVSTLPWHSPTLGGGNDLRWYLQLRHPRLALCRPIKLVVLCKTEPYVTPWHCQNYITCIGYHQALGTRHMTVIRSD